MYVDQSTVWLWCIEEHTCLLMNNSLRIVSCLRKIIYIASPNRNQPIRSSLTLTSWLWTWDWTLHFDSCISSQLVQRFFLLFYGFDRSEHQLLSCIL